MYNSEIHNGLPRAEVRDFLSRSLLLAVQAEHHNVKPCIHFDSKKPYDWAIRDAEAQIECLQESIKNKKMIQAAYELIEANGWEEHDVSDFTTTEHGEMCMSFIGTIPEYNERFGF